MPDRLKRNAAYIGPIVLFAMVLAAVLYFQPAPPDISTPRLPLWNFSIPDGLDTPWKQAEEHDHTRVEDPFKFTSIISVDGKEEKLPRLELSMVIRAGSRSFCRINGRLYHIHEKGPDFTVEKIGSRYVDARMNNGSIKRIYLMSIQK